MARRTPNLWLERVMQAGFSVPDLSPRAPGEASPAPIAPPPPLEALARRFRGHPEAVVLAQALWLAKCAQRHLRHGRLLSAQASLARALAVKADFFPIYSIHSAVLREMALAGGLFTHLRQAEDRFEAMPRRMRLLGFSLGLDQCGALVYAEWAAVRQLLGDAAGAIQRLGQALAAQERGLSLPDDLRQFLMESGCLADPEVAAHLAAFRRRLAGS
ncbi:MAG: hypothetical protein LDL11_00775 [Desulfarculus sp.]|nr:hypothetical protein [Desulfarculus sp.]